MKLTKMKPLFVAMAVASPAVAQQALAQDGADAPVVEEVLVTGFRAAQAAALDNKRDAVNNVESIVAEDIGKMPDLNLAESLQRSPGIAITREGGEGRQITVRGLGPEYTRVTLNGMEVPSSAGGTDSSGGTNRGRPFDFNVFGSELFSKIVVNKSAVGHVEEGGFASTVELFSHSPLDNPGLTLSGSIQNGFNVNSGNSAPRISGLLANTFMDDKIGVLLAFNHVAREVRQDGFGTVRWTSPTLNGGRAYVEPTDGVTVNGELDDSITSYNDLFFPRLPRMDSFNRDNTRTGVAFGLEFAPTDELQFGVKVLNSSLEQDTTSYNYFAQFRNTFDAITANSITVSPDGLFATAGEFENVRPRSESRVQFGESEFSQVVFDFQYDFSDTLRLTGLVGNANATYKEDYFRVNIDVNETAITAAGQDLDFSYELTNNYNLANMSYGFDVTDVSNYSWNNARLQRDDLERDYNTFKLDLVWDFDDEGSNVMVGLVSNDRNIKSNFYRDDVSNSSDYAGAITLNTDNTDTVGEVYGDFGDGIDAPAGFPTSWLVANFANLYSDLDSPVPPFLQTNSNTYDVTEETFGVYAEVNWILGDFIANAGLRAVTTDVTSGGYSKTGEDADGNDVIEFTQFSDSYDNVLPSFNLTYNISDEVRARAAWSDNVSRPNPSSLSGAVSVAPISGTVNANNPAIKPELARSLDLSLEWFIDDESYVGLTVFQKDISDSITSITIEDIPLPAQYYDLVAGQIEYQEDPVPTNVTALDSSDWDISTRTNSVENGNIDGWELGYQQVFENGIGIFGNYTKVFSNDVITGLSDTSLNMGVFWENETYGARLVMNERADYTTRAPGRDGNTLERTTGPQRFDISSHWHINDNFTATLEIINLTDEKERLYTTGSGELNLVREYNTTGTELMVGIRASF